MVGERIDSFLEKMQVALQEYQDGRSIREVLFSDNPGIIPRPKIVERVVPTVQQKVQPIVTRAPVAPRVRTTPPTLIEVPIVKRVTTPVTTRIATARAPATDPFSTLARGFARITGAEKQPPAGTRWLY